MDQIISQLIQALGAILAAVLIALATQALRRMGITLNAERQQLLENTVKQGVSYAEETAKVHLQKYGEKLESDAKKNLALDFVLHKLPKTNPDDANRSIQATLPMVRPTLDRGTTPTQ